MNQSDLDELVSELFDPDLPNVVSASFGDSDPFNGSLSREHIETDEIVGIRSVFLCASKDVAALERDQVITVDDDDYFARVIEKRGRGLSAVILGK